MLLKAERKIKIRKVDFFPSPMTGGNLYSPAVDSGDLSSATGFSLEDESDHHG